MQAVGMTPQGRPRPARWNGAKVDAGMHPAMTAAERRRRRDSRGNRTIRRLAMFWRAIEALLSTAAHCFRLGCAGMVRTKEGQCACCA
jgi:hypothetical protein